MATQETFVFDTLAGIVERNVPDLHAIVDAARFFSFPYKAEDVLPKKLGEDELQFLKDEFFLPFRTVAIEDAQSCVVLQDIEKKQTGANTARKYINAVDPNAPGSPTVGVFPRGTLFITSGLVEEFVSETQEDGRQGFNIRVTLDFAVVGDKDHVYWNPVEHPDPRFKEALLKDAGTGCSTAIQEIMYFNTPGRFIVEVTPDSYERASQKARKAGRITRIQDRPRYTILTPQEIRVLLKLPPSEPTGRQQAPHERRRVKRWLKSPMFTKKRFTWVTVEACWIGPDEVKIGKNKYKVRLDL